MDCGFPSCEIIINRENCEHIQRRPFGFFSRIHTITHIISRMLPSAAADFQYQPFYKASPEQLLGWVRCSRARLLHATSAVQRAENVAHSVFRVQSFGSRSHDGGAGHSEDRVEKMIQTAP